MSLENLSMTSDYPMDKIVYFHEDEYYFSQDLTVPVAVLPHGLPFTPLIFGALSTDNWQTTKTMPLNDPYSVVLSDANDVKIFAFKFGERERFKVRLYGFEPSNGRNVLEPNAGLAESFFVNSDYKYLKLFANGADRCDGDGNLTINHNLGFVPFSMLWYEFYAEGVAGTLAGNSPLFGYEVTDRQIIVNSPSYIVPNSLIHYRIYNNEA